MIDISFDKIKAFIKHHFNKWQLIMFEALLFSVFFIFIELFFRITQEMPFTKSFWYPVLFSFPLGFFFAGILALLPQKANCIIATVIMSLTGIWICTQICYSSVFQTYMEFNKVTMAGDVMEGFGTEMADAIIANIPKIIALILVVACFSLALFLYIKPKRRSPVLSGGFIIACLLLHLICKGTLSLGIDGIYNPVELYNQHPRILDNNISNFGVMTSLRLELGDLIFGVPEAEGPTLSTDNFGDLLPSTGDIITPPPKVDDPEDTTDNGGNVTPPEPIKEKNTLDIDLDKIIGNEQNKKLTDLHKYVQSLPGSNTNAFTGYFEGYNLIMICAESFTSHMISPELTPTLYKMSTNGFVFNNYYGTFKSITTNGEYAFCTGLLPLSRGNVDDLKKNSTFLQSADKYLPYAMGNIFKEAGANTFAYHGNKSSYYNRGLTHPNLGYEYCRFFEGSYVNGVFSKENGLKFSTGNRVPNSDYELAQQTLGDYLGKKDENGNVERFSVHYMTYSGHHPYYGIDDTTHTLSPMSRLNRDKVDNLNYSETLKSYLAANLEVENMVTCILEQLEAAGCLENTVIVLTNDHYPYGLVDKDFRALAGTSVDGAFGIYENSFICYNAGMTSPVVVDTPCCTVDIVPTLLNLFGFEYDSRLLAGTDVLDPNSFHIAMLYNQSFITNKIRYNASTGKVQYLVDKSEVSDSYVKACISYVKNKFEMSLQILENDYYKVFYDYYDKQHG